MFDNIKNVLRNLGVIPNNNSILDENGEPYTPEELKKLEAIRKKDFNYKNEFEKLQIKDFLSRFISFLKMEGWQSPRIVSFLYKFFQKSNLLSIWNEFGLFIRNSAGLSDLDDLDNFNNIV